MRRCLTALVLMFSVCAMETSNPAAAGWVAQDPEPQPLQNAENLCAYNDSATTCVVTNSLPGSAGLGGGGGPVCDPLAGCPVSRCETIIDDDSGFPDGLAWDGDDSVRPLPADSVIVESRLNELANVLAFELIPSWSDVTLDAIDGLDLPEYGSMPTGIFAESGQWQECDNWDHTFNYDEDGNASNHTANAPDAVTFGPVGIAALIDPLELYERARAEIDPPEPPVATAPPKDGLLFVKMPTWYWFEPGYWTDYSATAQSPTGRLIVTVTASPIFARWNPGDGTEPVICFDAGVEYVEGLHPWRGTECQHIYQHSSTMATDGSDTWVLDVEVAFALTWSMTFDTTGLQERGAVDGETRTTSIPLQVGEIQSIVID